MTRFGVMVIAAFAVLLASVRVFGGETGASSDAAGRENVERLTEWWVGLFDTTEQVVFNDLPGIASRAPSAEQRVRTLVERVSVPWIGEHVLYAEEFLHDDADSVRRQVLLRLEPAPAGAVRVRQYTFRDPARFRHFYRSPLLIASLRIDDLETMPECDLMMKPERVQFSGGTEGNACREESHGEVRYVDYRLVVGDELYWYRKRRFRLADNALEEEVAGYTYFELHAARLFSCRVSWSSNASREDRRQLLAVDLNDQGGRAKFETPDGRKLSFELHSQDWPFALGRDALILIVEEAGRVEPIASSWTTIHANSIAVDLDWLGVDCSSVAPEMDDRRS